MKNVAVIFSGQGSQYMGMGRSLYNYSMDLRRVFECASEAVKFDIMKFCCESNKKDLFCTEKIQPCILTIDVAMYQLYMEQVGIQPSFMAGHSLGEYAALVCGGAIDFISAVKLVYERGLITSRTVCEGMQMYAFLGIDVEILRAKCSEVSNHKSAVYVSLENAIDQNVVSGHKAAMEKLYNALNEYNFKMIPLNMKVPFHCPYMQEVARQFREVLTLCHFRTLSIPVIANVTALPYNHSSETIENLYNHMVSPVLWRRSLDYIYRHNVDTVFEIGPGRILSNMAQKYKDDVDFFSVDKEIDKIVKKFRMDSVSKNDIIKQCLRIAVCTPNNNCDETEYYKGVHRPYKEVESMLRNLLSSGQEPSAYDINQAIEMLKSVFITKGLIKEEQELRFRQLAKKTGFEYKI